MLALTPDTAREFVSLCVLDRVCVVCDQPAAGDVVVSDLEASSEPLRFPVCELCGVACGSMGEAVIDAVTAELCASGPRMLLDGWLTLQARAVGVVVLLARMLGGSFA